MLKAMKTRVWNFDLPPYPREGLFHLDMSKDCQVNRLLTFEAGRLAQLNQLDAFDDPGSFKRFQAGLRRKLWQKTGCTFDDSIPLNLKKFGTICKEGFTVTKLIYQSRNGIYVTGLLYLPEGKGPFPAVLQMHGHNPEGKFGINPQSMSLCLVKNGFVCLTVDAFGTYERAHDTYQRQNHGGFLGASLLNIGETLLGAQIVDNMRAVTLLRSLPFVKKDKIGAVGASGGGNQTMWLSAMDERVSAAMPVVSVGSFASYVYGMNCVCELLPDGLTFTEESGVLSLIAPRPLRIANALYDCNHDFSIAEMLKTYHPVERIYRMLGANGNISFNVADRVHGLTDRQRESALGFFSLFLKGEGNGNPLPEPEYELIPEQELHLFNDPAEREKNLVRSIPEHCKFVGGELRAEFLQQKSISIFKSRNELKKMLRLPPLPPGKLHRYNEVDGVGRFALECGNHTIPFLYIPGRVKNNYQIVLHPQGKAMLTEDMLPMDGSSLILPDLFGTGETSQENNTIGLHHQYFRQLLWVGHSLAGEWTYDILSLIRMLKSSFKAEYISLYGHLETGLTALCANALSRDVNEVTAVCTPGSLLFSHETISLTQKGAFEKFLPNAIYSLMFSVPGFLKWGDVSLLAALGNGSVKFVSMRTADGTLLNEAQVAAVHKEIQSVKIKLVQ